MVFFLMDLISLYSIAQLFKNSKLSNSLIGCLLSTQPVSQLSYFADNGGTLVRGLVEAWFILLLQCSTIGHSQIFYWGPVSPCYLPYHF